jgi:N-methylhydantoinase B
VRLFRAGEEVTDVWDIFRTNVRLSTLVEMDLRGLVAGCHFANERIAAVIDSVGEETFKESMAAIRELTEAEMRRRIGLLADGVYRSTSWTEFGQDFYEVPCTLTVDGDRLVFDYDGAAPQTDHFFNSKPYIIASELALMLSQHMASDLPYNDGIFASFELSCPEGTIVNAKPPAPIGAAHMHVGLNAAGVAMSALHLAFGASPESPNHRRLATAGGESAIGNQVWSWTLPDGTTDAFIALDGNWVGAGAGAGHDGMDLGSGAIGVDQEGSFADIEVLESWFPLLFLERRTRPGTDGAGRMRAGGGNQFSFRPHGIDRMNGTLFGMRRWLPLQGLAGGRPGSCAEFVVHRADGSTEIVDVNVSGIKVDDGEWFQIRLPNGGGFGDQLDRNPTAVLADVLQGRFNADEAESVYGVIIDGDAFDADATVHRRNEMRQRRLDRADPAPKPIDTESAQTGHNGGDLPLYPGVVQRGNVAYAEESGTPLAVAPDHWTDGCPVIEERRWEDGRPDVVYRTFLDPGSGRALHVEASLAEVPRSFLVSPARWSAAAVS